MTQKIDFNDIPKWQERLAYASNMGKQISAGLQDAAKAENAGKDALVKEALLVINLIDLAQLLWDTTEAVPGDVAGITLEEAETEARVAVRKNIDFAIEVGEPVLARIQAIAQKA